MLVIILIVASVLRFVHLGQCSLWYDEIVSMRLARTESPQALLRLLDQIDATRAPLHPLVLQGWLALLGGSEYAARLFSCLCGIGTVGLVYWVGLRAFDKKAALWASWLSAVCPPLVYYSREVRMYAWLVAITCLGWGAVFSHARAPRRPWLLVYGLSLIALVYSHPLGLLMVSALGLATLVFRRSFQFSWPGWLLVHLAAALAVAPWISRYTGHEPELIAGRLPIRYLLGTPIGFIGGNFAVLLLCAILIGYGAFALLRQADGRPRLVLEHPSVSVSLLFWLIAPPLALYLYSLVAYPIFGQARYMLFVAPAYLILVARGLGKLSLPVGMATAVGGAALSGAVLVSDVYRPDLKADWRAAAAYLDRFAPAAPVVVTSADPSRNVEVESARYYLGPNRTVVPWEDSSGVLDRTDSSVWVSVGMRDGRPVNVSPPVSTMIPAVAEKEVVDFPGLRLIKVERKRDRGWQSQQIQGRGGPDR